MARKKIERIREEKQNQKSFFNINKRRKMVSRKKEGEKEKKNIDV